ncbi:glycoside hydrolase family 31 protein [Tenggerimyces flavus]|uniref:Glycoside hydrolase family 31 protein n=1 Tax=Tenggerimyces flavus TaxID=1708749 RepID=A0ABV7YKA5_9ACTN|nr:glycoside hydrolase family 31 protein [Tenggerimyces flavus]MBM7783924.1 alpha-D-xyloside xylohydrolase [Tenggerimyces flavus]
MDLLADLRRVVTSKQPLTKVPLRSHRPADGVLRLRSSVGQTRSTPQLAFDGEQLVATGTARRELAALGIDVHPVTEGVGWAVTVPLPPEAEVYGGGESFQGPRLRGRTRLCRNAETHGILGRDVAYLNVPFFWSDAGWGLYLHSSGATAADLGATHTDIAAFLVPTNEIDVFVYSGTPEEILRQHQGVTGTSPVPPDWAFGVWMSRCSYLSETHVDAIVDELQAAGCPVDVIHVDAWVSGNVIDDLSCNWTIDRRRFPEGWTKRLRDKGVRTSLWVNPYVTSGTETAELLASRSFLVRTDCGPRATTPDLVSRNLIDFTNPEAVAWWQERVAELVAEGASAIKADFAEEVPADARFADGRDGVELRNEYALLYQQAIREVLSDDAVLFCRSGTAGGQRTPVHWVGDTPATWAGLVSALRASLSMSLSGFSFLGHDVGGFWTPTADPVMRAVFDDIDGYEWSGEDPLPADVEPELFARWAQWGALSPVLRFHGTGRREPTAYPEPWRSVAIEACRLRERLRPYLREAAADGLPMMRPMALAYPEVREGRDADLQYLLGNDVLVAPLLEPGGRRTFWVPPGRWHPLLGGEPVDGPGWTTVTMTATEFPAYEREDVA